MLIHCKTAGVQIEVLHRCLCVIDAKTGMHECLGYVPEEQPLHISGLLERIEGLLPLRYEPAMVSTDARVTEQLQGAGYEVRSYSGLLLREPSEVVLEMGTGRWVGHFGTLSPFLRCAAFLALACIKKAHAHWSDTWNSLTCAQEFGSRPLVARST